MKIPRDKNEQGRSDKRAPVVEKDLSGYKSMDKLTKVLSVIRDANPDPKRKLHFDNLASIIIFSYLNPILTSLRSIQQASEFRKVQSVLGVNRMSLGSMSESIRMFDPELLAKIYAEYQDRQGPLTMNEKLAGINQQIIAVDGSIFKAIPRVLWALWMSDSEHAIRLHTQFNIEKAIPHKIEVTEGNGSEVTHLRNNLVAEMLYVLDRGYGSYDLLEEILEARSSFVVRINSGIKARKVLKENEISEESKTLGIEKDQIIYLGKGKSKNLDKQKLRLIEIEVPENKLEVNKKRKKCRKVGGKAIRVDEGEAYTIRLVTDKIDLPADVIALLFRHRWKVELFFRTLKSMLGCRHLLSDSIEGITIQMYCALIALVYLREIADIAPNKRLFELFAMYMSGWVEDDEMLAKLEKLKEKAEKEK